MGTTPKVLKAVQRCLREQWHQTGDRRGRVQLPAGAEKVARIIPQAFMGKAVAEVAALILFFQVPKGARADAEWFYPIL